jgi:hypothetical protein
MAQPIMLGEITKVVMAQPNGKALSIYVGVSLPATVTLTPPERASPMRLARS